MTTFTSVDIADFLTDWFPVEIDPVHEGYYDVQIKSWPWPDRIEWTKESGWFVDKGIKITHWRGLKEKVPE